MSLRLRLLLAVGAIAIVALVVADFATYSALRSSLYNQVDQSWPSSTPTWFRSTRPPAPPLPVAPEQLRGRGLSSPAGRPGGGGGEPRAAASPTSSASATLAVTTTRRAGRRRSVVPGLRRRTTRTARSCPTPSPGFTHPTRRDPGRVLHRRLHRDGRAVVPGAGHRSCQNGDVFVQAHTARRPDEHPAHPAPHRARRDRGGARAGAGRRMVAGPARPAPARGRRGDRRLHRGRQPRPAGPRGRPGDRGRPSGPRAQRDARADPGRVLGPRGVRGAAAGERAAPAPVRRRRLPRAAHADRRGVGLRRAVRARRIRALRRPAAHRLGHPHRDGAHGPPRQRPPHPGPPRRGRTHGDGARRAGVPGVGCGPHRYGGRAGVARAVLGRATRSRSSATRTACARCSTTCWPTCGRTRRRGPRPRCGWIRSATRPRWRCATRGPACPPRRPVGSSSASTGSTPPGSRTERRERARPLHRRGHRGCARRHRLRHVGARTRAGGDRAHPDEHACNRTRSRTRIRTRTRTRSRRAPPPSRPPSRTLPWLAA